MQQPRVLGLAGWSGSGKTTLLVRLLPLLVQRGLRVATVKHAHHEFDVDLPGKDSYEHRKAGASEVLIASSRRWVQMHELRDEPEPTLPDLLRQISPCDLVLVEGFKHQRHPKLEIHRPALGKPALYLDDPAVVAVATDGVLTLPHPLRVDLNDSAAVADCVLACAAPLPDVLELLQRDPPRPNSSNAKRN
jgi:molybdopterin-guanine dinucleotide biosynthesis protein B